ncbi:MAG: glycosyltransferase family 9 protein [Ignavibacteria bacterium]|nr:glycosyltransferase family 9 protein [Ignavibacteria bacterium]MBI3765105.1 glycosyltransferase family 9 protein [Ignavibacteriales bacterium]
MKILLIALSGVGDALMFSPALTLLRKKYPHAQIDLLAMFRGVEELYARNDDVDKVIFYDFLNLNPLSALWLVLKLRRPHYDISINVYPANRWHYNVISFLIGAKKRLGHTYNHVNGRSLNFLNNIRIHEDDRKHNVEENVCLVELLGVPPTEVLPSLKVVLNDHDKGMAEQWIATNGLMGGEFFVGFHAGSSALKNHAKRRWSPDKFAQLGKLLGNDHHATVLLFGGPEEYELNLSINRMMGGTAIIVKVPTLMTSVALMKKCSVFVVNDSALMHIAAGLQLPVVTVFAYTNPTYVHPWNTNYILVRRDLECSPCFYYSPRPARCIWKEDQFRCITQIEVNEVASAVKKIIHDTSPFI